MIKIFDIFDPAFLYLLANYLALGLGTALAFVVIYHISTQNPSFSRRDLFFAAAGPSMGFLCAALGLPQADVMMYTFSINLGLAGVKDYYKKIGEIAEARRNKDNG